MAGVFLLDTLTLSLPSSTCRLSHHEERRLLWAIESRKGGGRSIMAAPRGECERRERMEREEECVFESPSPSPSLSFFSPHALLQAVSKI